MKYLHPFPYIPIDGSKFVHYFFLLWGAVLRVAGETSATTPCQRSSSGSSSSVAEVVCALYVYPYTHTSHTPPLTSQKQKKLFFIITVRTKI